jgi:hypothetical protein
MWKGDRNRKIGQSKPNKLRGTKGELPLTFFALDGVGVT